MASSPEQGALALLHACRARGFTVATAESCTGGLIAGALTAISGSSAVVDRGYVVYSNRAKEEMLGVPRDMLATHGAVSEAVAIAMAEGALARAGTDIAIAVTGIAGPGGATPGKPVGLVHLACARRKRPTLHHREVFAGDRDAVRHATILRALEMMMSQAEFD